MLRPSRGSGSDGPTIKKMAKRIRRAVQAYDDASVGLAVLRPIRERLSFLSYCYAEFQNLLSPPPNAPMSGAGVRSTEASAPLAG